MRRRGLALIVVVGVLGVMACLAVAFAAMAQLERRAALQRTHAAKAWLLARSGIEDALARISAGQDPSDPANRYGGEDWNGNEAPAPDPGVERDAQAFRPSACDREDCPARLALRPSFSLRDAASGGYPALIAPDGSPRGYSGRLAGDLAACGNTYALKVEDESGKINVNGGLLDAGDRDADGIPDHRDRDCGAGWNGALYALLNRAFAELGDHLLDARPEGGWRSMEEVHQAVRGLSFPADLSAYLTVTGWVDRKVVRPNPIPSWWWSVNPSPVALSEVKRLRPPLGLEEGGRPPVNLNAAPPRVLAALVSGLSGISHGAIAASDNYQLEPYTLGPTVANDLQNFRAGRDPSGIFAAAGLAPGPFRTWSQFRAFCDTFARGWFPNAWTGGGGLAVGDLLKANFDPNTCSNLELPDQLRWQWFGKPDLTAHSTEGCLGPTGTFTVTAVGRLLGPGGRLLAERSEKALVEAFTLLRQSTQKDFVGDRAGFQDYLSLAHPAYRTAGISNPSWKTWGGAQGLAAMTYPNPPTALPGNASDLDGFVALATVELPPGNPLGGTQRFLHHFDDSWNADAGSPAACRLSMPHDARLQTDLRLGVWPADAAAEPNTLYPDGMHAQRDRSPAFQALGNFPPSTASGDAGPSNHGLLCYWVKPVPNQLNQQHWTDVALVRMAPLADQAAGTRESACLLVGRMRGFWGIQLENADGNGDYLHERTFEPRLDPANKVLLPGLRWHLVTAWFDTDEAVYGNDVHMDIRCARGTANANVTSAYGDIAGYDVPTGLDLAATSDTVFVLGKAYPTPTTAPMADYMASLHNKISTNAVIDEFGLYDMGDNGGGVTGMLAPMWIGNLWKAGRYYKGNDAAFLSAVLEPDAGRSCRLLGARWTAYLPSEDRKELMTPDSSRLPTAASARLRDPVLANCRVEVDLLGADGSPLLTNLAQGGALDLRLDRFRYRVRLMTHLSAADLLNQPALESPIFDDITFLWQRPGGPRILAWLPEGG